jgi:heat shock protein HtpX
MIGPAFGLATHQRRNRWRSVFLIGGLFFLVLMLTFAVSLVLESQQSYGGAGLDRTLWRTLTLAPFAGALTAAWVAIGFAFNTAMIGAVTGSGEPSPEDRARLMRLIEPMCISRGMRVPHLKVIDSPALNAFASGVNERQFTVAVTTGLMHALDDRELAAVLAHELTHIRNGDVRLMIIAVLIAGVLSFIGEMMLRGPRFSTSSGDGKGRGGAFAIAAVIAIIAGFLSVLIRFALSRSREYLADAGAVELTKDPDAMISALLKIAGRADIEGVPSGIMDMCIENDPDGSWDLFSTHPSVAKRVQALVQHAGGHTPGPPRVDQRTPLPSEVERRGPWGIADR